MGFVVRDSEPVYLRKGSEFYTFYKIAAKKEV